MLNANTSFVVIFIYAPPNYGDKEQFWIELLQFTSTLACMFVLIGDFNEMGSPQDKVGGAAPSLSRYKRLDYIKSNYNVIDLPFSGQIFTWRKKICGENNIWERLDRVVVSPKFIEQFPSAHINHHVFRTSDHCQIQLSFMRNSNLKKATPFKLEKQWTFRKDFTIEVAKFGTKD